MKLLVIIFASTIFTSTFAQNQFSEADAHKVVNIFFEGFHKGDTLLMKSVMANAIIMQTAYTDKKGRPKLNSDDPNGFLSAIANRQADQKWDERLLD